MHLFSLLPSRQPERANGGYSKWKTNESMAAFTQAVWEGTRELLMSKQIALSLQLKQNNLTDLGAQVPDP